MKWTIFFGSLIAVLFLGCRGIESAEPVGSLGGDLEPPTAAPTVSPPPALMLNPTEGGPAAETIVVGSNFPPGEVIFLRLGTSMADLDPPRLQVKVDENGSFAAALDMPTIWRESPDSVGEEITVFAQTAAGEIAATAGFTLDYRGAFTRYEDAAAGFSLLVPAGWEISSPQLTPLGKLTLLGPPPLAPGNPALSAILVADQAILDAAAASELLTCGEIGCRERVLLYLDRLGVIEARSLVIGSEGTPRLEWFFINHPPNLIYFTLHDPLTFETLRPLAESIELVAVPPTMTPNPSPLPPTTTPTATVPPTFTSTATPAPLPSPTLTTPASPEPAGPVQTVNEMVSAFIRKDAVETVAAYFTAGTRASLASLEDIRARFALDFSPESFSTERVPTATAPAVVRATLTEGSAKAVRLFFLNEEEGRWLIERIEPEGG